MSVDRTCPSCGDPVVGHPTKVYCSRRCANRLRDATPTRRHRPPRNWTRPCSGCDQPFTSNNPSQRFCSEGCRPPRLGKLHGPRVEQIGPLFGPRQPVSLELECAWCGLTFLTSGYNGRFCSENCRHYAAGRRSLVSELSYGECVQCGHAFVRPAHHPADTCSAACSKRRRKYHRRALKRAKNGGEVFTLHEIAERDGWRCHLCGKKVPDRKFAARDRDPTLDHLVPVSRGGQHTRANVALAHNRCNWERGNELIDVQLRLIA